MVKIPKQVQQSREKRRGPAFLIPLMVFIVVLVCILLTLIIFISNNIFKSISLLEKNTLEIASGNLDTQIDFTDSIYKANEITNISKSLETMRLSLLEAQNRKIKLIMGISHDLRTPVAVIKGYTEGLKDGIITEQKEITEALTLIETKTNQLESMIDSLINYTKMNTTEIRQSLKPYNIYQIIYEFIRDSKKSAEVFNRKIESLVEVSDDIYVPLDKQLIQRALENLFSNALRYTKENDTIKIQAEQTAEFVNISISDTGIGISEEDLPHIFDLFYRGSASRREEGMGIGLSVVKNVINIHQWDISVESELNKGTKFIIKIPYVENT